MGYKLVFKESTEAEAKDAIDYYCEISAELGDRFLNEILETYEKLAINPEYYSYISSVRPIR